MGRLFTDSHDFNVTELEDAIDGLFVIQPVQSTAYIRLPSLLSKVHCLHFARAFDAIDANGYPAISQTPIVRRLEQILQAFVISAHEPEQGLLFSFRNFEAGVINTLQDPNNANKAHWETHDLVLKDIIRFVRDNYADVRKWNAAALSGESIDVSRCFTAAHAASARIDFVYHDEIAVTSNSRGRLPPGVLDTKATNHHATRMYLQQVPYPYRPWPEDFTVDSGPTKAMYAQRFPNGHKAYVNREVGLLNLIYAMAAGLQEQTTVFSSGRSTAPATGDTSTKSPSERYEALLGELRELVSYDALDSAYLTKIMVPLTDDMPDFFEIGAVALYDCMYLAPGPCRLPLTNLPMDLLQESA